VNKNDGASERSLSLSLTERARARAGPGKRRKKANAAGHAAIIGNFAEAFGVIEKILLAPKREPSGEPER